LQLGDGNGEVDPPVTFYNLLELKRMQKKVVYKEVKDIGRAVV
jgi:hypothetical protein